jgi:subtilisin family serine protease
MRRPQVLAAVIALLLLVGVGVALSRRDGGKPTASPGSTATPTTAAPTPSATETVTASPTTKPTPSPTPSPVGKGPRDREYDVVYAAGVTMADGAFAAAEAGGEVINANAAAGVVTVRAGRDFLTRARRDKRIHGAVRNRAVGLPPAPGEGRRKPPAPGAGTRRTNAGNEPLQDLQWDMSLIHTTQAHAKQKGDKRVIVAVIDTGVDGSHPDLAKVVDRKLSRNFVTDYPGADGPCEVKTCKDPALTDGDGHGTHVAGTIAAAADGFGMAGVAPGVTLVDLRAGQDSGLFLLMPTVDALVYAGDIGVDVANMSYFNDPWLYNCPNGRDDSADERYEQRAMLEGVRRAVEYAHSKGVTLVGAAGNEHADLGRPSRDVISPDFPEGAERPRRVDTTCQVLPTDLDHVVRISSVARDGAKADYSNYGSTITVSAPGGSTYYADGSGPEPTYGTLSTWSESLAKHEGSADSAGRPRTPYMVQYCKGSTCGLYRYLTGTSMASPHAAGVAALIVSKYGKADPAHPGGLTLDPARVAQLLQSTATDKACPASRTQEYAGRPAEYTARCDGTAVRNTFYGEGVVDALKAVS